MHVKFDNLEVLAVEETPTMHDEVFETLRNLPVDTMISRIGVSNRIETGLQFYADEFYGEE